MDVNQVNRVILKDGFKTEIDGKTVPYTVVKLRPATVAMDMRAIELSERLVNVGGVLTLKMSEEMYRIAMTMQRIERVECSDAHIAPIGAELIDLNMISKLHPMDLARIEQQILIYDLYESYRFGNISQAQFEAALCGDAEPEPAAPQPAGEGQENTGALAQTAPSPVPVVTRLD